MVAGRLRPVGRRSMRSIICAATAAGNEWRTGAVEDSHHNNEHLHQRGKYAEAARQAEAAMVSVHLLEEAHAPACHAARAVRGTVQAPEALKEARRRITH